MTNLGSVLDDFNPEKDKVNSSMRGLPEGKYFVSINKAFYDDGTKNGTQESKYESFVFIFQVIDGEHAGEQELDFINLSKVTKNGKEMPSFVLDTAVKSLGKLAYICGVDIPKVKEAVNLPNVSDEYQALDKLFHGKQGTTLNLSIKVRPNKKNPDRPNKNYEFEKAEQPEEIDVSDDDMPF